MSTNTAATSKGEWLEAWDPENEATWDKALAWKTLWITTFSLVMCFVAWFLPSAIVPKLNALGYSFTKDQLYWLASIPGIAAVSFRTPDLAAQRTRLSDHGFAFSEAIGRLVVPAEQASGVAVMFEE